jgi:hypothetical protein
MRIAEKTANVGGNLGPVVPRLGDSWPTKQVMLRGVEARMANGVVDGGRDCRVALKDAHI